MLEGRRLPGMSCWPLRLMHDDVIVRLGCLVHACREAVASGEDRARRYMALRTEAVTLNEPLRLGDIRGVRSSDPQPRVDARDRVAGPGVRRDRRVRALRRTR